MSSNQPVKRLNHGTLQVSIWKNYNDGKAYYNVNLVHRYNAEKDREKPADWQSSSSIAYRDLPAASVLLVRASNWIAHKMDQDQSRAAPAPGDE